MPVHNYKKIECDYCGFTDTINIDPSTPPDKVLKLLRKWIGILRGDSQMGQGFTAETLKWYDCVECAHAGTLRENEARTAEDATGISAQRTDGQIHITTATIPTTTDSTN